MRCSTCGRVSPVAARPGDIRRHALRPLFEADPDGTPAGPDELEFQLECPNCGGGAAYVGTLRASRCPFCAAAVALRDVHEAGGRLPIDGVIPFAVSEDDARRAVRSWMARSHATLRKVPLGRHAQIVPMYLPVLGVDARLDVDYQCFELLGPGEGSVSGDVRDVVVALGTPVDQQRLEEFRPWPLDRVVPYRPEYLAGMYCESYDKSLPAIRALVRAALRSRGEEMVLRVLQGPDREEKEKVPPALLRVTTRSANETYRHVLVPVFLVTSRDGDVVRQVVVSGVDGTIRFRPPLSWVKVGFASAGSVSLATVELIYGLVFG